MRMIWQYLKTRVFGCQDSRDVGGGQAAQHSTVHRMATQQRILWLPMSAAAGKLRSPDVEKTQGLQATATAMNGSRAKSPIVPGVLLLLSIAGHLAPTWKLLGLPAARGERADPLQATENLQWMSATVVGKSRP